MAIENPAVIVTGSSGLIGHPVCLALAECGYEVFGFDRVGLPEPPKHHPRVHDVECDLTRYEIVRGAVQSVHRKAGERLASVVHLAAYYDFSGADSPLYEKVTVHGTDRLLNALSSFQLEQFLFSSTTLVHAPCKIGESIHEDDPLEAKWAYPQSKIETERLIREGHPDLRSVFLRIAGIYTDSGKQPTLVQQIKRIYEKDFQGYFFPGNPEAGQSLVHLDDVVEAIVRAVERRQQIPPKTAILIGEAEPVSYEKLQDELGNLIHGKDWATLYVPKLIAKAGAAVSDVLSGGESFIKPFMIDMADDHYALDISRAKEVLGWEPRHCLLDTLPKMVAALKRDPQKWYQQQGLE